ncbi:hypothetical protein BOTBODRAFT_503567 [Botryobasidium botryosum FD-172 SS1]|uniref:Uncharacterized protein n=1 Tax=Botryobasidium botryosum (strain FD-172 SS1) TaxID=930990 RepID=A0A067MEJ0_BOTB1|nr:hypothetical protein BOTBODRAFT_503567 [Botryobasidium botryosum FD-172 SS1]
MPEPPAAPLSNVTSTEELVSQPSSLSPGAAKVGGQERPQGTPSVTSNAGLVEESKAGMKASKKPRSAEVSPPPTFTMDDLHEAVNKALQPLNAKLDALTAQYNDQNARIESLNKKMRSVSGGWYS